MLPAPLNSYTVRGVRLQVDARSLNAALEAALASGRYESAEAGALEHLLRPEDVYFELGAGVGFLSVLAWRVIGDAQRIHVFEANPDLIDVIRRTWSDNGAGGQVRNWMLGKGRGVHAFNVSRAFWASSGHVDYGSGRTIDVEQRDFLKQLEKRGATFVMMDIEGGEVDLLDQLLPPAVRAVVAEYHPKIIGAQQVHALWSCLESQGFRHVPEVGDSQVRAYVR